MKVIQINCVYGKGSTGKITADLHNALLENGVDSYVFYGRGIKSTDKNVIKVSRDFGSRVRRLFSSITGEIFAFSVLTNVKMHSMIKKIKPDLVHLQCINGYCFDVYRLISFLKKQNIPTVLTMHAEFMYTGGCGYSLECDQYKKGCVKCPRLKSGLGVYGFDRVKKNYKRMLNAFKNFDVKVVGVSDWISNRAKESLIMQRNKIITIHNGINTNDVFYPREYYDLYKKYSIPTNKKIVLTVLPNLQSDLKGGPFFLKLAQEMLKRCSNFHFIIIGAKDTNINYCNNLTIISYTENQIELAKFYSMADVFFLGSKMDNYPTVCVEANSCGTPVVGFDVGGVSETIKENLGEVVPYGDIKLVEDKLIFWAERKSIISREIRDKIMAYNSTERMVSDYIFLYKEILNESN
ncbi:MAG: glycosyltransferase [Bacilli bacterium]|nr:glycosyltransferase [Bacilli bacterium]